MASQRPAQDPDDGASRPALRHGPFDLAIVGGGVNGCGIARDAVGRGLSVLLVEQSDLASGTSSWSTKLIHGGLRYLEHYEFSLVREALMEREVLWRLAPHIIHPLRFVLPHRKGLRPAWFLRLGLFVYDHLGGRALLPPTVTLDLTKDPAGALLKPELKRAFEYSDCAVDDARLVVLNARDAAERGADIRTRTRLAHARREGALWSLDLEDRRDGRTETLQARGLINAAGPWVEEVLTAGLGVNAPAKVRLVQGSHLVVRRRFEHDKAYIFQGDDRRIVFAIPYEGDLTLIGTTDQDFEGDPSAAAPTEQEIDYLLAAVNEYFAEPVTRADIAWSFAGVRPLYDDGASAAQEATRDYVLSLDAPEGNPPALSIFGGKITTYRRLAQDALGKLAPFFDKANGPSWTDEAPLPGGDFPVDGLMRLVETLAAEYPFLTAAHAARLARAYGTRASKVLGGARSYGELGRDFGASLTEAELAYLMREEWALEAEDVVWRRSKLGLRLSPDQVAAIGDYMRANADARAPTAAA